MDALRISLIVIGLVIIAMIYWIGRRQLDMDDRRLRLLPAFSFNRLITRIRDVSRRIQLDLARIKPKTIKRSEPVLDSEDLEDLTIVTPEKSHVELDIPDDMSMIVELTSDQIAPEGEQLFVPLTIIGRHGRLFEGETIIAAMDECDFVFKDNGLYYYEVADMQGYSQNLLGLANIMEPGIFELDNMSDFTTPGLVLFLHLPAPIEAREAFDVLLSRGRALAFALDGDLCDDSRNVLTNQTIGHLREKVETYRFKQKMTQIKNRRH